MSMRKLVKLSQAPNRRHLLALLASIPFTLTLIVEIAIQSWIKGDKVSFLILINQLGDVVAAEPAARQLASEGRKIVWVVAERYISLVRHLPYVEDVVPVTCPSEWIILSPLLFFVRKVNLHIDQHPCNWFGLRISNPTEHDINFDNYYFKGNLLSAFSKQGLGYELTDRPQVSFRANYVQQLQARQVLPPGITEQPFVAVHFSSAEAERSLTSAQARGIVESIQARGIWPILEFGAPPLLQQCPGVFALGSVLDLDLQAAILSKASMFVGVDSGFSHIANATQVESLILMGKYRHFVNQMPYSGPWQQGIGVEILRSDQDVSHLSIGEIDAAVKRLVSRATSKPGSSTQHLTAV